MILDQPLFDVPDAGKLGSLPVVFTVPPRREGACVDCSVPFVAAESSGRAALDDLRCQTCWEDACAKSFREEVAPIWEALNR